MKRILLIVPAVLFAGCVSYFLQGAKEYRGGPPPGAIASFKAENCKMTSNGEALDGPTATYYLANTTRGPALYEVDASGSGSAITNYWRDNAGHHFAVYVRGRQAWEYVLPDQRDKPGIRKVFMQYQVQKMGGGFRISGQTVATCDMVNPKAPPAPSTASAPPPPPAPSAPPEAPPAATEGGTTTDAGAGAAAPPPAHPKGMLCVPGTTQECVGGGACHGGQHCLPDGSGYSECDCGKKKK